MKLKTYGDRNLKYYLISTPLLIIYLFVISYFDFSNVAEILLAAGFWILSIGLYKLIFGRVLKSDQEVLDEIPKEELKDMNKRIQRNQKKQFSIVISTLLVFGILYAIFAENQDPVVLYVTGGLIVFSVFLYFVLSKANYIKLEEKK